MFWHCFYHLCWEQHFIFNLMYALSICYYYYAFLASSLIPYLTQVRLMVGLLKSVGTGDLTTADGLVLCSTSLNTFFASCFMMVYWSEYLPLMQLREFWMQRRWLLHPVWHLLVVCTLLTWNMIWMLEGKFYLVSSVDGPPGFVSCWLSKVYLVLDI